MYHKPYILNLKLCHYLGESFFSPSPEASEASFPALPALACLCPWRARRATAAAAAQPCHEKVPEMFWGSRSKVLPIWVWGLGLRFGASKAED